MPTMVVHPLFSFLQKEQVWMLLLGSKKFAITRKACFALYVGIPKQKISLSRPPDEYDFGRMPLIVEPAAIKLQL